MNPNNFDVAPHGFILLAGLALLLIILIHATGFRVVGALRVGR